jgi:hypothetical protein
MAALRVYIFYRLYLLPILARIHEMPHLKVYTNGPWVTLKVIRIQCANA